MSICQSDFDWLHVLCQDMDRARALTVSLLVSYSEWDQLVSLRIDPSEYNTWDTNGFKLDYQITELLRKTPGLPLNVDLEQASKDSFYKSEAKCLETNRFFKRLSYTETGLFLDPKHKFFAKVSERLSVTKRILRRVLGPIPDELVVKFSPGATYDDRRYTLVQDKMSSRPTVTSNAYTVVEPFWRTTLWCKGLLAEQPYRSLPRFVAGNRFTSVPKDSSKNRGICIEPSLNVTHQLSVGAVIRKRLRRVGIDIKYAQSLHQGLMDSASLTRDLVTIDLSSASDSVSYELIRYLLPPDWFDLLDSLRSPATMIDDKWWKNEKFSSMGNGFTFELETLIFFALAKTVSTWSGETYPNILCFGDDIIVNQGIATEVVALLQLCGFETNNRKTFINDVPFRESCGAYSFHGIPIKVYHVKELPSEPIHWFAIANGIRRMADYELNAFNDLYCYKRTWLRIINHVPKALQSIRGPSELGDAVIHDRQWPVRTNKRTGLPELRTLRPQFDRAAYTAYDRPFWTRDSILAAVIGGYSPGDTFNEGRLIGGKQIRRNSQPIGWKVVWVNSHNYSILDPFVYSNVVRRLHDLSFSTN